MSTDLSLTVAFIAGMASFFAPCIVILVPAWLAQLAGVTLGAAHTSRTRVVLHTFCFALGFTAVFMLLGATASALGALITNNAPLLSRLAGVILVLFGLMTIGILRNPFTASPRWRFPQTPSYLASCMMGVGFGISWTPCITPLLAAILTVAATGAVQGTLLLGTYALGIMLPLLILAFCIDATPTVQRLLRSTHQLHLIAGCIIIAFGVLMFTQQLGEIAALLFTTSLP